MIALLSNIDFVIVLELIIAGLAIGIIAAMVGIGGGLIMVPTLILIFGQSAQLASAISIVVIIFTSGSASFTNFLHKRIDIRTGILFAVFVIPCSFFGSWLAEHVNDTLLVYLFGFLLLIVSIDRIRKLVKQFENKNNSSQKVKNTASSASEQLILNDQNTLLPKTVEKRTIIDSEGQKYVYNVKLRWALVGAAIGGFLGGLLGLGGGIIFVPVLLASGVPPYIAFATSSFIIIFTALSGSLGRILFGHVNWTYVIPLAIGTVTGARFGALKMKKISSQKLLILFYVLVFLAGIRMILKAYGIPL